MVRFPPFVQSPSLAIEVSQPLDCRAVSAGRQLAVWIFVLTDSFGFLASPRAKKSHPPLIELTVQAASAGETRFSNLK
jgi:hypothetical protein